ncbi:hypothetical protein niasHT_008296 [Heterodera trifolii]|uniref:Uncharacterized protein n=1 Tax=Heterodera trifolii TaxID=157864 RepID=A0ABD2M4G8_9BILA
MMALLNREMEQYDRALVREPVVLLLNKVDEGEGEQARKKTGQYGGIRDDQKQGKGLGQNDQKRRKSFGQHDQKTWLGERGQSDQKPGEGVQQPRMQATVARRDVRNKVKVSRLRSPSPHAAQIHQLLYDRFVYIPGTINNRRCFILVDMASHVSLVSLQFWNGQNAVQGAVFDQHDIRNIIGVNGTGQPTSGRLRNARIRIGNFVGTHSFDVLGGNGRNGPENHATIGLDFLLAYGVRIDFEQQRFIINRNQIPFLTTARANELLNQ